MKKIDILLIEDSFSLTQTYIEYLKDTKHTIYHCSNGDEALSVIDTANPSLVILDLKLPDMNGMDILDYINTKNETPNVVIITAHGSVEKAVEAMQKGAFDFIEKPFNARRLRATVQNALNNKKLKTIVDTLEPSPHPKKFIGSSYPMKAVYHMIRSASASNAAVFITGESGTGKEICAVELHNRSKRQGKPFVALNCGAIPHDLMESEIFGHKKGAFTGALADRDGAASSANGGTLFLDEICEMDMDLQIKLLRFIQTKTFRKVGADVDVSVDIRFLCATNKDPLEQVRIGKLREDLYYRLHVIPIHMPPLNERDNDIIELSEFFLNRFSLEEHKKFSAFHDDVLALFSSYSWPGNVRELQNIIHQVVVLHDAETVSTSMLPDFFHSLPREGSLYMKPAMPKSTVNGDTTPQYETSQITLLNGDVRPLWIVEKEAIEQTIIKCAGNVVKAAACLEVSPSTVYRKMRNWGIDLN
ncbi:MAG: sigma-54-dependent Fis family transcriptional regulator [Emcibacter sp.]|nr:sigma-54-dependent Fis family transcriptional regulator [Emcibacter sp.]